MLRRGTAPDTEGFWPNPSVRHHGKGTAPAAHTLQHTNGSAPHPPQLPE